MVKETLNSAFDNFKERTTNPFLGTLIVVWIVNNWRLLYSLFYFDIKLSLKERLIYIEQYFQKTPFYLNLFYVFLVTVLVLSVTYLFLGISRFISDFYEKVVIPKIVKFIDKSEVVLRSDYLKQQEFISQLERRLEEERLAKATAQKERDASDDKLSILIANKGNNDSKTTQVEESPIIDASFLRIAEKAKRQWTVSEFNNYIALIKSGILLSISEDIVRDLLREDFITLSGRSGQDGKEYKFTKKGDEFLSYWNSFIAEEELI